MFKRFYQSLFFARRFYWLLVGVIFLFIISYAVSLLFVAAQLALLFLCILVALDYTILFSRRDPVPVKRILSDRFSNGDLNKVALELSNRYPFRISVRLIDELPDQFQRRGFYLDCILNGAETQELSYEVRPVQRGEYVFHSINIFIKSPFGVLSRRVVSGGETMVRVLPSWFQMKQYELIAHSHNLSESGSKKIRKLGHSLEFEQIKEYVRGDDIRSINWRATARKGGQLMVNKYTDEKSQQIYCIIDKGRVMKMPFNGMSLLDYAINATLILSRVALIKQDKAGLITFADQIGNVLPADRKTKQMSGILDILYNQQTRFMESDFEKLYALVRARITQRSLLVLFTNFESLTALQRQLPYLRKMARNHLLLVVFFDNTELKEMRETAVQDVEGLYSKTIAEKFAYEKRLIVKELQKHGIATILTAPERLTVNAVNKYLEIKARLAI